MAADLIISSQGQKMSRWILDAPAEPEIESNDILCTIAFGIDNEIGSSCCCRSVDWTLTGSSAGELRGKISL